MAVIVTTHNSAQGVAATTIMEGRAVTLTASGVRNDLPNVTYAAANQQHGVFIAFFPPDNFPRPTYEDLYSVPSTRVYDLTDASLYGDPTFYKKQYLVPRSMWAEPVAYSGELVALHHGRIGITASCFVNEADIRVPGARVAVGASGLLVHTTNNSYAIGIVERYAPDTGVLYISMGV
jgi:hypothetical protein